MRSELELATMARKLAIKHISGAVEAGNSEHYIAGTWHGGGRSHKHWADAEDGFGGYEVSVGGYYDLDETTGLKRKKVSNDKILVQEVCGVEGIWIFSLHEIYQECKQGQVSLL